MNIDLNIFPVAWYAVTWSKELGNKPIKVRLLGKDYVLFRDEKGIVRCLNAYCPHRGADLSLGFCHGGQLQCAYHGWRFEGDGTCVSIPAHPNKPVPSMAHARSYPVREAASLIWLYPQQVENEETLPPLGLFKDLYDDQYTFTPTMVTWQAHVTRVVESILDMTHLHFVHRKTIGRYMKPTLDQFSFTVEGNNWDIHVDGAHIEFIFPQHMILRRPWGGKRSFINYYCFTPIDENQSKVFCVTGRNFARHIPGMNKFFMSYNLKIFNEDKPIVESQNPISIPEMMQLEVHVDSDGPQVRYRQRWYQFLQNKLEPRIDVHEQRLNILRS
ncbi:aromatic ring-hydroxylating oxygenase subunit alpha [Brevibacillus migulae]|uniref:aromatic ring-hydroxylating oxygenase subunit alpha n=1 Tax=Brevibacillus migulae TaxID=1644114 RepID=UPI00106E678B|nr:aromatic ring-hydroxylating dioxygenase subunit alpha [Brevibacillus migulae]